MAADKTSVMEEMVVTGVRMETPLHITTDPKKPRQPLPAGDGADYLKTIPGFSVIRKGGIDGDPMFRGMAGSRLAVLLDGALILGGCSSRMDPPTAYIFPETFDAIKMIKGPQSVRYGPGNSTGAVLFENTNERPTEAGWDVHTSLLAGSASRRDGVMDIAFSSPQLSVDLAASSSSADDYEDGDGVTVHSEYERWNAQAGISWTPNERTIVEFNTARSDGEAAYADRGMDGSKFDRENYDLKYRRHNPGSLIETIDAQIYYNYVDHVMDNYSLRRPSGMMSNPAASNPDRETSGGKIMLTLSPAGSVDLVVGLDAQENKHTNRSSMNQTMVNYRDLSRSKDAEFTQVGTFAELDWKIVDNHRVIAGLRVDDWEVTDLRQQVRLSPMASVPNPTAGQERNDTLKSGFIRYETGFQMPRSAHAVIYTGIGHSKRFPDYWEMIAKETTNSVSALNIDSEETTQLDAGIVYREGKFSGSVSIFYNNIDNYLMIESGFEKRSMISGMTRTTSIVRNIDARSWGLEVDSRYQFTENWRAELTLASVRGANDTDNTTLPQLPPLETRVSIFYENAIWSAGILWRALASQDRVAPGQGNIVGQDFGPTDSANVLSLNGGWKMSENLLLTAGIDNLLDETYAEHVSRSSALVSGFEQTTRVNEPGRTLWLKAQLDF